MINCNFVEQITPLMNHIYMQKKWFDLQFKPISKKYGLKSTELSLLVLIHLNKKLQTASDIEKFTEMKRGNISLLVECLSCRGYLLQEAVEGDRRRKRLVLTEKSNKILEECDAITQVYLNNIFKGIPKDELEICMKVFNKMNENQTALSEIRSGMIKELNSEEKAERK